MKNNKVKNDIILILSIILFALICAFLLSVFRSEGEYVCVIQNGKETARYPLSKDITVTLENGGTNTLVIENGYAFISDASCPDRICVHHKKIKYAGEAITCLPNKTVVKIGSGGKGVDAVS